MEQFPIVQIIDSMVLPDNSVVIRSKSIDGRIFINRFTKKNGPYFQKTPYSEWPIIVADLGVVEYEENQDIKQPKNEEILSSETFDKLLEKGKEIVEEKNVEKISAILTDQSIIKLKEEMGKKKNKKKINKK